jgi:GNAT superfamily N-acetyltransferase
MQPTIHRRDPQDGARALRIRTARRGEAEALAALLGALGYPESADAQTVNWVLSHPEMEVLVAVDSHDRPIGMLSLSHRPQLRMKGRIASVDELVVHPEHRRKGVGRELVKRALERAKVLSVKRVEILTHHGREEIALSFLKAVGFAETPELVLRVTAIDFRK